MIRKDEWMKGANKASHITNNHIVMCSFCQKDFPANELAVIHQLSGASVTMEHKLICEQCAKPGIEKGWHWCGCGG